jgi:radical SAM protein with 4Fe4S-binding SPASM domain
MERVPATAHFEDLSTKARVERTPESATIELTYGCNLRCVHCYNPTHRVLPQELTTAEFFSILQQVADLGVLRLSFTGGEAFTRPDAFEIFREGRRLGFVLYLISNATRITDAVGEQVQAVGFDCVNVSIYGATKPTYEAVTGVQGSYEAFLRGLSALASRRIPVLARMPVMTLNAGEVGEAKALIEHFGFRFQYCLEIHPRTDGNSGPLAYRLAAGEKARIEERFRGFGGHDDAMVDDSCSAHGEFIDCACGRTQFAITPYGEMNLCVAFPIPKYDLRKGTVKEGWEVLKRTVDRARPNHRYECPSCDLRKYCRQGRNDAWLETGDMSVCLPHFKELAGLERRGYDSLERGSTD